MKKTIRILLLSTLVSVSTFVFADETPSAIPAQTAVAPVVESTSFTPAQMKQLDGIIHDYIVNNPQVLVEASRTLQAEQEKKAETVAMTAIEQNKKNLFDDAQTPAVGDKEAPVTMVEFFDYQCGHCREMAPQIEKLVSEDKELRVVFKELPIFGGMSQYAAKVALAAAMQSPEKYYTFHSALFAAKNSLTKESIMAMAKKAGLNVAKLKKDMESPAITAQLKSNFELAQALKVMGTPTFVIGNKAQTKFAYIPGATSLESLKEKIKSVQ